MIYLQADQEFFHIGEFLVKYEKEYNPTDLVEVYKKDDPEKIPICSFQANYIATGEHA